MLRYWWCASAALDFPGNLILPTATAHLSARALLLTRVLVLTNLCPWQAGMLYIVSRVKWAKGYATGDPMNRYQASGGWGKHIWTSLLVTYVCAASTALGVAGIL